MRLAACLAGWLTCLPVAKALFWKTLAPALADSQKASSDLFASADKLLSLPLLASKHTHGLLTVRQMPSVIGKIGCINSDDLLSFQCSFIIVQSWEHEELEIKKNP